MKPFKAPPAVYLGLYEQLYVREDIVRQLLDDYAGLRDTVEQLLEDTKHRPDGIIPHHGPTVEEKRKSNSRS